MSQGVPTEVLLQVIGEQQVAIKLLNAKIVQLTEQLKPKEDKDETTEDN